MLGGCCWIGNYHRESGNAAYHGKSGKLFHPDRRSGDLFETRYPAHFHRVFQLCSNLIYIRLYAFFRTSINAVTNGLAMMTASAPSARALNTSTPLRIPPSTNIFMDPYCPGDLFQHLCCRRALIQHTSSMIRYYNCRCPGLFCLQAPLTVITPFTINGIPAIFAISPSSSTVLLPAGGSMFLRNGSPAASPRRSTRASR